jgi:DNA-binding winged helix-turn-helix (wHTH) protein
LLQPVWGYQDPAARHIVDVFIGRLRLKLQQRGLRSPPIVTVRGAGFKLVPEDDPPVLNEREPPLPRGGPQEGDELEVNVT